MSKPPIPPMPDLDWSDVPEIKSLPWAQLKLIPYRKGRWYCCAEGCRRHTTVYDFGLYPTVYRRGIWLDIIRWQAWFFCGRHYRGYLDSQKHGTPLPYEKKSPEELAKDLEDMFWGPPLCAEPAEK